MTRIAGTFGYWIAVPLLLLGTACSDGVGGGSEGSGVFAALEMDASYPEPFSYLNGVRELPDGRLFAADPLSQVLLRVDMDAGVADTLGRVGEGPGEYQQPDQVFALPGDSTLLVDIGKTYLAVIGPDGTLHDGMPMAMPVEDGPPSIIMPSALDAQGRLYFQGMGGMGDGPQDSTFISRYDRATARVEPAVSLWRPAPNVQRSGGSVRMMSTQMEGRDDWAVGPDGRIAVIRANGYRVDWYLPDGTVVSGPDTPYEAYPISEQDKEQALEERNTGGLMMMVTSGSSGGGSISMSRGGGMRLAGAGGPNVADFQWAEEFPAFRPNRSMVSMQNEVWVQRYLPGDLPQEMDVFGPDGVRRGSIELPKGTRLIGFGHGPHGGEVAYLVRTDDVGLQWLERYRVVRG